MREKLFSIICAFSLLLNSVFPVLPVSAVYADDSTQSATVAPEVTPSPTPESSPESTPESTLAISPSPTPEISPAPSESPVPTIQPENIPSPSPTENIGQPNAPPETPAPSETTTPSPSPSVTPVPTPTVHGHLAASIVESSALNSLNLDLNPTNTNTSASLTTNKPDYSSTEVVIISGTDFVPNTTYTLEITSSDQPPIDFKTEVITNDKGSFIYSYQLDGNYRPNYSVELKDSAGTVVAATTFTDSPASGCTPDSAGANDEPGQKDLTKMCVNYSGLPTNINVSWNWDDTGFGGKNTGDACSLYDTDGDGNANYALCVGVNGDPAIKAYTKLYSCSDNSAEKCTSPFSEITSFTSSCSASVQSTDPFSIGDFYPNDTEANCTVNLSDIGGAAATLVDVCSFESGSPTSNPADCILFKANAGKLTVTKVLSPSNDSGLFNLQVDGTTQAANVGDGGTTLTQEVSSTVTHTIGETEGTSTSLSNYTSSVVCKDGHGTGNTVSTSGTNPWTLSVADGSDILCTITNTRVNNASITIVKDAQPNDAQDFAFTTTGSGLSSFSLDDDSDPTLSNTKIFSSLAAGTYSVSEGVVTDWTQTSATCSDGSPVTAIDLTAGESVTCTFTNTRDTATLTVNKVLSPGSDPGLFNLQINGATAGTGANVGNGGTTGSVIVNTGSHTVGETAGTSTSLSNYTSSISCSNGQSGSGTSLSVTVAKNDNTTCTITNTRNTGTLRVLKNVDLNGDGDYTDTNETGATDWKWQANGGSDHNTGDAAITIDTGNYALTETPKTDFHQVGLSCTGGTLTGNSVAVTSGANVICTFTNAHDTGTIELKKAWSGTGGQTTLNIGTTVGGSEVDFQLTGAAGTAPLTTGQNTVNTGTYNVSENGGLADYNSVLSCFNDANNNGTNDSESTITPDGSNNVIVTTGQHVICTFTNTRNIGTIELKKVWSGTAGQTTLQIGTTADGNNVASTLSGASGGAPLTTGVKTVDTGTYYVSETGGLTNYDFLLSCTDNGLPVTPGTNNSLTVAKNHTVVCTFTNTRKQGKIELQKDFVGTTENVTIKIGTNQGGSQVDSDILSADGTDGEHSVDTGNYFVSETLTALVNYTTGLVCYNDLDNSNTVSGGDTAHAVNTGTGEVSVGEGDDVLCVFTNTRNTGALQVFKNVDLTGDADYSDPNESGAIDWTWDIAGGDQDIATGQSKTLNTGSYTISEDPKANYHLVDWSCSDETSGTTNSILANVTKGTTLICTFFNARDTGTIKVVKDVVPNDNGATGWDFDISGSTSNSASDLQDGEESSTFTSVTGSYTVTESAHSGTNANNYNTTYSCSDNTGVLVSGSGLTTSSFNIASNKNVVCTFTNTVKNGTIIIQKDMVGGTDSFDFTGEKPGTISTSSGQLSKSVLPGIYTATESTKLGWDLTGLTCDDSDSTGDITSRTATFHVNPDETVKCTFTNTKRGHVVIEKNAIPDNSQQFTFSNNFGNDNPATFSLTDDDTTGLPSYDAEVLPGTYSVSENDTSGWELDNATCDDGSPVSAIAVSPGETVTCTFTNNKLATIILNKNTIGGDGTFNFVLTGFDSSSAQLITATGSATQTFSDIDPDDIYSISETVPTGWDLTSSSCSGTNTPSNITPNNGETVTCTFTNTKRGHIIVDKITDPSGDLQSFDFEASGSGYVDFSLKDTDTPNDQELVPGTYSVSENGADGWDPTGASCDNQQTPSNITLGAGETVRCTFTNTKRGHLTIQKTTLPGGELDLFTIQATGSGTIYDQTSPYISDSGDSILTVTPGTYYVTEDPLEGWDETSNGCQGVVVGAGQDVSCTITNTQRGTILGTKQEVNSDSSFVGVLSGWVIRLFSGETEVSQTTTDESGNFSFTNLVQGVYALAEDLLSGWTPLFAPSGVTLNPGNSSTGNNFGNFKNGQITGIKFDDLNGNGQKDEEEFGLEDWKINLSGAKTDSTTTGGDGYYEFTDLGPGSYTVCEEEQPGWQRTRPAESNCETVNITQSYQTSTVDFGNQGRGTITIDKVTDPSGSLQVFDFTLSGQATGSASLKDQDEPHTFDNIPAGSYTLSEAEVSNWTLTNIDCGESGNRDGNLVGLTLNAGGSITCTFSNTRDTETIEVHKKVDDGSNTYQTGDSGANEIGFRWSLDGGDASRTMGSDAVVTTGDEHNIDENSVAGYVFTGWYEGEEGSCANTELKDLPSLRVVKDQTRSITLCNKLQNPILTITKSNNKTGIDLSPGGSVLYTLTVEATQSAALDVKVIDLPPAGFKYRSGSFTASSNINPGLAVTEPTYASPGTWNLGNMAAGEIITLTYIADIDAATDPGLYKDLAWAKGKSLALADILANKSSSPEFFVGTEVNVVKNIGESTGVEVERKERGEVLGISTSLPATGVNTIWVVLAALLVAGGAGLMWQGMNLRRKYE